MAILFVDLVSLAPDREVGALAAEWLAASHSVVYVWEANHPRPAGLPEREGFTDWIPAAGEGALTAVVDHCLEVINRTRRRAGQEPQPHFLPTGGRPCALATLPGLFPAPDARRYQLQVLIPTLHHAVSQ